ncbi:RHS repeat-associated core domain-containing protein [Microbulbifer thermotolerans]|nr:RHS repeat-associated core domain-containing protein [Microbulbifer thermotolerans]
MYQGAKPHAVTKVGTVSYEYDDNNGNLTSDSTGREFFYTSFDKPSLIKNTGSNDQTAFFYGPDRSRYKRIDTRANGEVITTLYLGNVERIHRSSDGKYRWKRYLPGGGVFTYTTDADFNQQSFTEQYLLKDHIGSTDVVLDANGNILETMAFDPWGKRRDADWQAIDISDLVANNYSLLESLTDTTTKGFTGHEMVDALGVIHMNGRIYDPELGRFLQADPFIDGVGDTQGYNRYSYVKGNPLTLTDPTGYYSLDDFFDDVNKFLDKYIGDNGGSFEIGITYGGPGGTGNGAGWGGASFWAETGTGGASTPEGTVPGAFGESKKEEESIWDKITIQGTSENGGGFDSELAVESLVHLEVDGQSVGGALGETSRAVGNESSEPITRKLTEGEMSLAKTVFGDEIDLTKVRLTNRNFPFSGEKVSVTPSNTIWLGKNYRSDFSSEELKMMGHLIHELTHVWQYQNGVSLKWAATKLSMNGKSYKENYHYSLGGEFKSYNIEQQATIFEHQFYRNSYGNPYGDSLIRDFNGRPIPESSKAIQDLYLEGLKYGPK